jgi:predicted amidohydrolase
MLRNRTQRLFLLFFVLISGIDTAHSAEPAIVDLPKHDRPPRKVIVGTTMTPWYGNYPGLEKRLEEMSNMIDTMAADAKARYGRSIDLAVFSEYAVTAGKQGVASSAAVPLDSRILDVIGRKAREHGCYVIFGGVFCDKPPQDPCTNSAVVIDRKGQLIGKYDKVHPVLDREGSDGSIVLEGGVTAGDSYDVFDLDFGRIGIQICYDVEYPEGWRKLAEKGAEIVLFPTQSPQLTRPAMYAATHEYWVISSTFRNNASFFEPGTGLVAAQIREPNRSLVHEIDLSFAVLPWSPRMRNGASFREKYGDRVGFRYSESEDRGVFWSNDPGMTIGDMARSLDLLDSQVQKVGRAEKAQDRQRGGPAK